MLRKLLLFLSFFPIFIIANTHLINASLLVVNENGKITWQVLSEEDSVNIEVPTHSFIEVKKTLDATPNPESTVELTKSGDKVSLVVTSDNEKRQIEIKNSDLDLVEIEERPEIQKINIGVQNGKFRLYQKGVSALTDYPIKIDPVTAKLTIATQSGERFLSVLPYQAAQTVLRSKLISTIDGNKLDIIEQEMELQYSFSGQKVFNILNLFDYSIPVTLKISATTGETVSVQGPLWYKVIGFFLS